MKKTLTKIVLACFVVLACLSATLSMVGCEGKIISPISGEKVTASMLVAEEAKADREASEKASAAKTRAEARIRAAKLKAEREAMSISQTANIAAADAQRQLRLIELELGTELESATVDANAALEQLAAAARMRDDSVGDALEQLAAKESAITKVLGLVTENPAVKGGLASVGVDGGTVSFLGSLLFGGGAVGILGVRAKKREEAALLKAAKDKEAEIKARDEAWDEAQRAKEAEIKARDQAWDDAKREAGEQRLQSELTSLRAEIAKLQPAGAK